MLMCPTRCRCCFSRAVIEASYRQRTEANRTNGSSKTKMQNEDTGTRLACLQRGVPRRSMTTRSCSLHPTVPCSVTGVPAKRSTEEVHDCKILQSASNSPLFLVHKHTRFDAVSSDSSPRLGNQLAANQR